MKRNFQKWLGNYQWEMARSRIYYMRMGDYNRELFYKIIYEISNRLFRFLYRTKRR